MASRFTPTKKKRGDDIAKSGDDWCKSFDNGDKMSDCVKFVHEDTGAVLKCADKPDVKGKFMAVCKVQADPDQTEVYNDLPDEYFRDECFKVKKGNTAIL
jgi:hypothetical protein